MLVKTELYVEEFEFWSGACETVEELTQEELEMVWEYLEECYPDGMTDTEINDFFWFERDIIAQTLGYDTFDELMERDKEEE